MTAPREKSKPAAPAALLALVLAAFPASGCMIFHRNPPQPPTVVITQPPIIVEQPPVVANPPPLPAPPPANVPSGSPPPVVKPAPVTPPPRRAPARPPEPKPDEHPDTPAPAPATDQPAPVPQLSDGLSASQRAQYRRSISAAMNEAQNGLRQLSGRNLDSQAAATRSQASEYVRQAQEALDQGDLVRSLNLAQKAVTLTRFLLGR